MLAEGREAVRDQMTFDTLKQKYFRFWDVEDSPEDNTFDKYQRAYFQEKEFDVTVTDGQLNLEFRGENWACCVSAVVLYPAERAAEGRRFLDGVVAKRRFYFDNYFHRVLHKPTGDAVQPTAEDEQRGYVIFTRDYMQDVFYNDRPRREELDRAGVRIRHGGRVGTADVVAVSAGGFGFGDRHTARFDRSRHDPRRVHSARLCVQPRQPRDDGGHGLHDRTAFGHASRHGRRPPRRDAAVLADDLPADDTPPGTYRGAVTVRPEKGRPHDVPVEYRVYQRPLDPVDIPVGPWGHEIRIPWDGNDPAARTWNETMARRSLEKLRQYGLTTCSGLPRIRYLGFRDGKPAFDFRDGDEQMQRAQSGGLQHAGGLLRAAGRLESVLQGRSGDAGRRV